MVLHKDFQVQSHHGKPELSNALVITDRGGGQTEGEREKEEGWGEKQGGGEGG